MKKLVSIIIPIYNVEKYLDRCINSACKQTYKDIEIILVDDGSTDTSSSICDHWQLIDNRIIVQHKKNNGLSSARNAGLDIAKGEYIYFLDGDDYIEPQLLETVVPFLDEGVELVSFRHFKEKENGDKIGATYRVGEIEFNTDQERFTFILDWFMACSYGWEAWSRVFVRKIIEDNQLRFADNKRIFAEDMYFSLCYFSHINIMVALPDCLYHYIIRSDSIMSQNREILNIHRFNELAKEVYLYYQKHEKTYFIEYFDRLYFSILYHQRKEIWDIMRSHKWKARAVLLQEVKDKPFMMSMLRQEIKEYWRPAYVSCTTMQEFISLCQYIVDGNYISLWRRNKRINKEFDVNRSNEENKAISQIIPKKRNSVIRKRVYYIGSEEYGNIGDHQINESTVQFLTEALPDSEIIEITAKNYFRLRERLLECIDENDVLIMPGGGNFGDVYPVAQDIKDDVIRTWDKNIKIIFPQTVYFSDTEYGKDRREKAIMLYDSTRNITLFAREQYSLELASELFDCNVMICPDIVLRKAINPIEVRENRVLWCIRNDIEKQYTDEALEEVITYLENNGISRYVFDLQLAAHIAKEDRKWVTAYALKKFKGSRLVITDRLHGMIFAAVTGTPCIVLNNYNYKVKGCYEWIKHLPYIRFVSSAENIVKEIGKLYNMDREECVFDNSSLAPYYHVLEETVKNAFN